jgi:two-component system phosphate regulon sensor histidine kinase PhoR
VWSAIAIFLLVSLLIATHLGWRTRFRRAAKTAITELETLQRQLAAEDLEHQAQQSAIFNSMVEGLLLLDEHGSVQLANRAFKKLFAVTDAVLGKTVLEVLRLHELAEMVESLGPTQPWHDRELKFPGPPERWLQVSAAVVLDGGTVRQGTILVFHDLTRLKQLERTREEFVGNVSHELRTPLSLIKGYAETLLDGAKDNPEVAAKFLQTIDRNARRLDLLIQDLLTISALESGRIAMNPQPVSLRAVVERSLGDLRTQAAARKVALINQVPELTAHADETRVEQVFGNLLENAVKYGRDGGTVTAGGRDLGDGNLELFVQDDGPGIPAEALERVFERFYRVDKARSREQGGTGLGLSIVKHIVQAHGGRVWVESQPSQGAKFFFTLPAGK